ncbi:MAG: hypothetical protein V4568_17460 [Pseudomonadota bacterium]
MLKKELAIAQAKLVDEWRDRLARQQSSGQSIAGFCRKEGITEGQFYGWRSRLGKKKAKASPILPIAKEASPFIDIGSVNTAGIDQSTSPTISHHRNTDSHQSLEVRIDLGFGMVLRILRH